MASASTERHTLDSLTNRMRACKAPAGAVKVGCCTTSLEHDHPDPDRGLAASKPTGGLADQQERRETVRSQRREVCWRCSLLAAPLSGRHTCGQCSCSKVRASRKCACAPGTESSNAEPQRPCSCSVDCGPCRKSAGMRTWVRSLSPSAASACHGVERYAGLMTAAPTSKRSPAAAGVLCAAQTSRPTRGCCAGGWHGKAGAGL